MRISKLVFALGAMAVLSGPVLAQDDSSDSKMKGEDHMMDDSMMMTTMKGGEVMAVMPNGQMGTMQLKDDQMMSDMEGSAQAMEGCMMFMTNADGKTMMVDTSSDAMMQECEKIAK